MLKPTREQFPEFEFPTRCQCGVVCEMVDMFFSYERDDNGESLLICTCCASEQGHIHEEYEVDPTDGPVCRRKTKVYS
jgi:hypothetical protein